MPNTLTVKRKIAFVVNRLLPTGPIFVVQDIVRHLDPAQYDILLVELRTHSPLGDALPMLQSMNVHCVAMNFSLWELELATARCARRLGHLLEEEQVAWVNGHSHQAVLLLSLLGGAPFGRVATLHCFLQEDISYSHGRCMGRYAAWRQLKALKKMDACIAVSEPLAAYYRERLEGAVVQAIPNGIDTCRFRRPTLQEREAARLQQAIPLNAYVLLMVGALIKLKNGLLPIRAMLSMLEERQLPPSLFFLFVGDGPEKQMLQDEAFPLKNVRFVGSQRDIVPYLFLADAIFSASYSESFGLSVAEGIAAGLTPILADTPVMRMLVEKGAVQPAFFFDHLSTESCKKAILASMQERIPCSADAFSDYFSSERMAHEYEVHIATFLSE